MQELAPTPTRVDLVLQYLQEWPTPLGENENSKSTENAAFTSRRKPTHNIRCS